MNKFLTTNFCIFLILICFQFSSLEVHAIGNVDWFLVKENESGKEWLDLGSLKKINEKEITALTRFYENPNGIKEKGETSLYLMKINCSSKKFKDISKNGIPTFNSKWELSNDDELIESVIDKSCSEEILQ